MNDFGEAKDEVKDDFMSAEQQIEDGEAYVFHREDVRTFQFRKLMRLMKKLFPHTCVDGVHIVVRGNTLCYNESGRESVEMVFD